MEGCRKAGNRNPALAAPDRCDLIVRPAIAAAIRNRGPNGGRGTQREEIATEHAERRLEAGKSARKCGRALLRLHYLICNAVFAIQPGDDLTSGGMGNARVAIPQKGFPGAEPVKPDVLQGENVLPQPRT